MSAVTAIIGGSGLAELEGLEIVSQENLVTPYGETSSSIQKGEFFGKEVLFLARHGRPHSIPPHKVNYRANIWALQHFAATEIIAVNAVGGINPGLACGELCLPHQLIDYSWGRQHSFYDDAMRVEHVDFSDPYDLQLRQNLVLASVEAGVELLDGGVYACTQGPRLETAAEIDRLERDGCDIVGMTGMPEAGLAREAGLPYASLSLVVNMAAGRSEEEITMAAIESVMAAGMDKIRLLLGRYLQAQNSQAI